MVHVTDSLGDCLTLSNVQCICQICEMMCPTECFSCAPLHSLNYVYMHVCLSVHQSVCLSVCLSVCHCGSVPLPPNTLDTWFRREEAEVRCDIQFRYVSFMLASEVRYHGNYLSPPLGKLYFLLNIIFTDLLHFMIAYNMYNNNTMYNNNNMSMWTLDMVLSLVFSVDSTILLSNVEPIEVR